MRLPALVLAVFLLGALTACKESPTGIKCRVTGVDTLWLFSATGDSLPAIITTEWCG